MKAVIGIGKFKYEEETELDICQREKDELHYLNTKEPDWLIKRKKEYHKKIDPFIIEALSDYILSGDKSLIDKLTETKDRIKLENPKK